jgi:AcrR family transcriptional regulator
MATDVRERIVRAAAALLTKGGQEAVSTRAVSAEAKVQAPAIYRQFTDMRGLLRAAAREVLAAYIRTKAKRVPSADPVEDLQHGWDVHVAFGLANPDAYALMYGESGEADDAVMREGHAALESLVARLADVGRLKVTVAHAVKLIQAGANGTVFSLLATPRADRDVRLSDSMRDAVFAAILVAPASREAKLNAGDARVATRAVALRSALAHEAEGGIARDALTVGERALLGEWLDRLATPDRTAAHKPSRRR